ncbi:two-component regulator propeller domain-containing protein [Chitinophaga eiseniae]|uniref:histidine kinase n=1 Tax=Chitinophaga eiseniae TaxID=634771 RepID=A0A847SUA5_9BACT|nr:two-component regulator propeller domain-containing protein [Chitinophaga eiseniae]NLR81229.1 response regulator [Chitinophaga eiseniae]
MAIRNFLWTIVTLAIFNSSTRADDFPGVSSLGIEQGLSNNSVTCIFQDHKGFMWFGTYDGLNRYDGYEFTTFRKQPGNQNSLVFNRITSIEEDAQYNLWVGTIGGLSIYNAFTSRFSTASYIPANAHQPTNILERVNAVKSDKQGNIFVATNNTGLLVYRKGSKAASQVPYGHLSQYDVTAIEFDKEQRAWLFIRNEGLCQYDYHTNTIQLINNTVRNGNCLKADSNSNIFVGANSGVFELKKNTNALSTILPTADNVVHLTLLKNNDLWIATDGGGIFISPATGGKIVPFQEAGGQPALSSPAVYDIFQDKENRIWIGTLRGGINMIDPVKARFKIIRHDPLNKNSLVHNFSSNFSEDAGHNLWIATDGGGLSYWIREQNKFINYQHEKENPHTPSGNLVTSVLSDADGKVWMSFWNNGINRFNQQSGTFEKFSCINTVTGKEERNVWRLYMDKQQQLWAATFDPGSLYRFNRQKNAFELFDDKLINLMTIQEDREGGLWAGEYNTLIKIDPIQKKHTRYTIGSRVRAIHEDKDGRFWVGTEDSGLLLFDRRSGTFKRFTEKDGLCSNAILSILEDARGNLWLSTYNGISKFDPVSLKFTNYSESDNLQSNQFIYNAALVLQSGEMVFGGIRGFNIFRPEQINANETAPPVFISGIKINNVPIEADDAYISRHSQDQVQEIKLPFNKATLSLDFVALEYTSPDKISYAYRLEGRDDEWIYTRRSRSVNYTSLHEGKYIFKVKATDTDGAWTGKEQQLTILVLPPWYRSWWAYLMYAIAGGALIYAWLRYQAQKTRMAFEVAWAKKETEREKEMNEKKLSFFTNVSHEFRAPLTLIINPLKELLYHPEKASGTGDLSIVYRNARRLLSLVDQLLLFRKADTEADKLKIVRLNFSALCREVYICFSQQAKMKAITYDFHCDNPDIELFVDREKMEILLFNLFSNALKFTPEGGTVSIHIEEDERSLTLKVCDSGCGIESHVGHRLFERFYQEKNKYTSSQSGFGIGLYLVKQFVEAHKGKISYQSEINNGTQFTLVLQKGTAHFAGQYIQEQIIEAPQFLHELVEDTTPAPPVPSKADLEEIITDKKAILVVDDNAEIRGYLSQIFKEQFIVHEAANGETAWQLALQHLPDLVISDVVMGGMTGVELCRKIKEEPSLVHTPVILLTASLSSEVKLTGLECGADDYITKPFEKDLLIARVNNILRNRNVLQQYFFDRITLKRNYTKIPAIYKEFLEKCITVVEKNIDNEEFSIKILVKEMNMSHSSLYKKVKATSGQSISAFIRLIRLRKAAVLLLSTNINVSEAAFQVGISDVRYFRRQFVKVFGIAPSEYIKKYKGSFDANYNLSEWRS